MDKKTHANYIWLARSSYSLAGSAHAIRKDEGQLTPFPPKTVMKLSSGMVPATSETESGGADSNEEPTTGTNAEGEEELALTAVEADLDAVEEFKLGTENDGGGESAPAIAARMEDAKADAVEEFGTEIEAGAEPAQAMTTMMKEDEEQATEESS